MTVPGTSLDLRTSPSLNQCTFAPHGDGTDLTGTPWWKLADDNSDAYHYCTETQLAVPAGDHFIAYNVRVLEKNKFNATFTGGPNAKFSLTGDGFVISGADSGIRREVDGSYTCWNELLAHAGGDLSYFWQLVNDADDATTYQGVAGRGILVGAAWFEPIAARAEPTALYTPPVVTTDAKLDKVDLSQLDEITDPDELKKCFALGLRDPDATDKIVTLDSASEPVYMHLRAMTRRRDVDDLL